MQSILCTNAFRSINTTTKFNVVRSSLLAQTDERHKFIIKKVKQVTGQARQRAIQLLGFKWIKYKTFSAELMY